MGHVALDMFTLILTRVLIDLHRVPMALNVIDEERASLDLVLESMRGIMYMIIAIRVIIVRVTMIVTTSPDLVRRERIIITLITVDGEYRRSIQDRVL